jgi:hypothetical protein
MATLRVRIVILTVRITLSVCPFNHMAHTANTAPYLPSPGVSVFGRENLILDGTRVHKFPFGLTMMLCFHKGEKLDFDHKAYHSRCNCRFATFFLHCPFLLFGFQVRGCPVQTSDGVTRSLSRRHQVLHQVLYPVLHSPPRTRLFRDDYGR